MLHLFAAPEPLNDSRMPTCDKVIGERDVIEPWLDDPFPDYDAEPVMMYAKG